MIDFAALSAPFRPEEVSWRVGLTTQDKKRGMALAYIDARNVMDRLDAVCGPAGWQCTYPHAGAKTVCRISLKIGDEWIAREDGAGDTDVEAEKGALSDAFKRAAVKWGIGRYLYDVDSPWVEMKAAGRSYAIADHEYPRLRALLAGRPAQRQERIPVSSGPPAREARPEQPDESPDALKARMLGAVERATTLDELEALTTGQHWRAKFPLLPEAHRKLLNAAATKRYEDLARQKVPA